MAVSRYILAPLSGAFVATTLFYTFSHGISSTTQQTLLTLRGANHQLRDLDPDDWDKRGVRKVSDQGLQPAYQPPRNLTLAEEIKGRWNEQVLSAARAVTEANYYELVANGFSSGRKIFDKLGGESVPSTVVDAGSNAKEFASGLVSSAGANLREGLDSSLESVKQAAEEQKASSPGLASRSFGERLSSALRGSRDAAGKVKDQVEDKKGPGLGKLGDTSRSETYYLGQGTSLR
ncbi:hypothetical protein IE53DRAFT_343770 [Violaceomyces palustris]|uniref:Uncharacterized protein n=1 Tax=Violaceomyces palustris TaxID=1673888 RepID=A0ACD0NXU8_9BASI|nr:hypothetical protein IE53DRAFT_343770 [Violaceomyces palustris]